MSRLVVDASVAVKWVLPETHSDAALAILDGGHDLVAPDLLYPEAGNVLWKRVRRGELGAEEAAAALQTVAAAPVEIRPSLPLVSLALEIALQTDRTVYDGLCLALAVTEECYLVTADSRLFNSLQDGPLAPHLHWVADPF